MSSIAKAILAKRKNPEMPESQMPSPVASTGIAKAIMGERFKNKGAGDTQNEDFLSAEQDEPAMQDVEFDRKRRIAEIMDRLK